MQRAPYISISISISILVWIWICLCMSMSMSMMRVSCICILKGGDSLNSSSQLDSPNGRFTLRFYTPTPQQSQTNATYIAILFNPPPDHAPYQSPVLWIGNRDNPIIPTTPLLTLTTQGHLIITRHHLDPDPILLSSPSPSPYRTTNVTATLSDTGNLLIQDMTMNSSSSSIILWQSFDHPTDTLLPGMKLGGQSTITSWLSQTNPASGAFTLEWDQASGEIIIRRRGTAYWRSGRLHDYHNYGVGNVKTFHNFNTDPDPVNFNFNMSNEGDYFVYTVIPVQKWTPDKFKVSSGWRLDWSGNLTLTDERGLVMAMATVCDGFTTEGPSMYSRGCQLRGQPRCRNRLQTFVRRSGNFVHANGRDAYTPSLSNRILNLSLSDCRDECWTNCECVGYSTLLGRDYGCSYWIGRDLVWDQDNEGLSEVKYVLQSSRKGKKRYVGIILGVVTSVVVVIMLGLAYLIMRSRKLRREEQLQQLLTLEGNELESRGANSHHLKLFGYASVLAATNSFSSNNKLGEGGFGPVYKGVTAEGQDIAVKLLSRQSGQGLLEFKNELILISELQHVNLVKLLGFCIHKDDKMIIYDYMPNKSLDCFLFSPSKREQLDWKKRFNIIEGTAQGLLYLHKHSRLRIIHRDMKPNNILLDENMTPKISDFGLARIFKEDSSEVNTNKRVGTYGYMAPEYAMQGIFSVKSDVYSFGVLLLEIVSGRRNNSFHDTEGSLSIVEYAWELWRKDCAVELMDPMLRDPCIIDQLQRCIQIGLLCVENQAVDRPTIEYVLLMLKNETITLPIPMNPACITRNNVLQQVEKKTSTKSNEETFSANQVTLSEIDGR